MFAEDFLDGFHFVDVADRRRRAVRIEVGDVGGRNAGVADRHFHAAARTVGRRRRDVEGVARKAVAHDFGVDLGAARESVFKLFEDEHARAFAHHEAVAVLVEGTRSGLRIVVAARERVHGVKGAHGEGMNRRFAAARDHDRRVAALDHVHRFADGVQTRRARRDVRDVRALEVLHDRELTRDHVDDAARNHEGRNAAGTAVDHRLIVRRNDGNAADPGADGDADFGREFFRHFNASVFERHDPGGHAEMHEAVEAADFLDAEILRGVKILHFTGDLRAENRGVELRHRIDAAFAAQSGLPTRGEVIAEGSHRAETGNDNTTIHA